MRGDCGSAPERSPDLPHLPDRRRPPPGAAGRRHRSTPARPPRTPRSTPARSGRRPHHSGLKLIATLSLPWLTAVKAEPLTWAVLFWFVAPGPVACCCEVAELPKLSPPTPVPRASTSALVAVAFAPSSARAPLSAAATPVKRAAASGRAETAATRR